MNIIKKKNSGNEEFDELRSEIRERSIELGHKATDNAVRLMREAGVTARKIPALTGIPWGAMYHEGDKGSIVRIDAIIAIMLYLDIPFEYILNLSEERVSSIKIRENVAKAELAVIEMKNEVILQKKKDEDEIEKERMRIQSKEDALNKRMDKLNEMGSLSAETEQKYKDKIKNLEKQIEENKKAVDRYNAIIKNLGLSNPKLFRICNNDDSEWMALLRRAVAMSEEQASKSQALLKVALG